MSASLAASTVTPGSTAPEVSFTTPVMALCAWTTVGTRKKQSHAANANRTFGAITGLLGQPGDLSAYVRQSPIQTRQDFWRNLYGGRVRHVPPGAVTLRL